MSNVNPASADDAGADLARSHYENFPVASWLLPKEMRRPVRIVYAFARAADDIADEGDDPPALRHARLAAMAARVNAIDAEAGESAANDGMAWLWPQVRWLRRRHQVPIAYLLDLISAFDQDIDKARYADAAAMRDYTRRSADPVGRLMLHLAGRHRQPWLEASDQVCSGLQLINFCQDIHADICQRGRLYLPADELEALGIADPLKPPRQQKGEAVGGVDFDWRRLNPALERQTRRAMEMIERGRRVLGRIGGVFGLELRWICRSGLRMGRKLLARDDPRERPTLGSLDRASALLRALWR